MARRLIADGNTGRVAIMKEGSRDALVNPKDNLSKIHFHSDLDYLAIVQQVFAPAIALPAIRGEQFTVTWKEKGGLFKGDKTHTEYFPKLKSGVGKYVIGDIVGDVDGPIIAFRGNSPMNLMPVHMSSWSQNGNSYYSERTVTICVEGGKIILLDTWTSCGASIPAITIGDVRLAKFNLMTGANLTSNKTLEITPTRFIASRGKLDSRNRYVYRAPGGPLWLFTGKTLNVGYDGGLKWATCDAYGNVSYVTANGYIEPTPPFYAKNPTGVGF